MHITDTYTYTYVYPLDLAQEMDGLFGPTDTASTGNPLSPMEMAPNTTSQTEVPKSTSLTNSINKMESLTHVDAHGKASMVDVSTKPSSTRVAIASGRVMLGHDAFQLVSNNQISKGDVLAVAKIAGIQGAKQTGSLIPLCHNILLTNVQVNLELDDEQNAVKITSEASSVGMTGVEMEALTAVSIAALTVYDMCKAVSKDISISDIQLEAKKGGKSGDWCRTK